MTAPPPDAGCGPSMDWRRRIADYDAARRAHENAERLLAEALSRRDAALAPGGGAPLALAAGVDLARRRARRDEHRFAQATFQLTRGRALDEVLWSLPDEI
jgi:hypothetical protein